MSTPNEDGKVAISAQAALNETTWFKDQLLNRNLLLAQAVHELTATVEVLRKQLDEANTALEFELSEKTTETEQGPK